MGGNENSLQTIFLALRTSLTRIVMRIVPPRDVEDIVQETYVRACQIDRTGENIEHPRALMYRIARNLALDHIKRAENRRTVSLQDHAANSPGDWELLADQTFDKAASDEEFSLFCRAVRHLPIQCRRVFVLKKVYGYSQQEIARQLNISENSVEKHVATGIKRCTYFLQQFDQSIGKLRRSPSLHENTTADQAGSSINE